MVNLGSGNAKASIEGGELVSYRFNDFEYIHQKGSPGWRNSDTEMFPVIGPTADAGFRVHVPRGNAIQDQHGLLRELDYELLSSKETTAQFVKSYKAGTVIKTPNFPTNPRPSYLSGPLVLNSTRVINSLKIVLRLVSGFPAKKICPLCWGIILHLNFIQIILL